MLPYFLRFIRYFACPSHGETELEGERSSPRVRVAWSKVVIDLDTANLDCSDGKVVQTQASPAQCQLLAKSVFLSEGKSGRSSVAGSPVRAGDLTGRGP